MTIVERLLLLLAILAAIGASLIFCTFAFPENNSSDIMGKYQDFSREAWYAVPVEWSVREGIFVGTSETALDPDRAITRAEFITVLVKFFGYQEKSVKMPFQDVKPKDWFYPYVSLGSRAGITVGVSETEFQPNRKITREQAVTMLLNAAKINADLYRAEKGIQAFPDYGDISDWALPYLRAAVSLALVHGYNNGELRPMAYITRAETAQILYNIRDLLPRSTGGSASSQGGINKNGGSNRQSGGGGVNYSIGASDPANYVLFDCQNGAEIIKAKIEDGHVSPPEEPAKSGYVFGGWYTGVNNGYKFDFGRDTATPNLCLYARWYLPAEWYLVQTLNQSGTVEIEIETDLLATVGKKIVPCKIQYGAENPSLAFLSLYLVKSDGTNGEKLMEQPIEPGYHTSSIEVSSLPGYGNHNVRFELSTANGMTTNFEGMLYVSYLWDRG